MTELEQLEAQAEEHRRLALTALSELTARFPDLERLAFGQGQVADHDDALMRLTCTYLCLMIREGQARIRIAQLVERN